MPGPYQVDIGDAQMFPQVEIGEAQMAPRYKPQIGEAYMTGGQGSQELPDDVIAAFLDQLMAGQGEGALGDQTDYSGLFQDDPSMMHETKLNTYSDPNIRPFTDVTLRK